MPEYVLLSTVMICEFSSAWNDVLCTYQCKSRGGGGSAIKGRGFDAWDYPPVGFFVMRSDPGVSTFDFDR